jgi:hypothetical protein
LIVEQQALANQHASTLDSVFQFLSLEPIPLAKEKVFSSAETLNNSSSARLLAKLYFSVFL